MILELCWVLVFIFNVKINRKGVEKNGSAINIRLVLQQNLPSLKNFADYLSTSSVLHFEEYQKIKRGYY